jgi:hypothetical protein
MHLVEQEPMQLLAQQWMKMHQTDPQYVVSSSRSPWCLPCEVSIGPLKLERKLFQSRKLCLVLPLVLQELHPS